ncbi:MAG TPA: hypothetical protein VJT31_10345 [Rugosimonospora sp.]|nr:hypothetical protein [Rugosimonospora sp.]
MNWVEYTEAAQRLAEVRRQEGERQAGVQERTGGLRTESDRLKHRLTGQRNRLLELAQELRLTAPALGEVPRSGLADTDEAVRRAWEAVEQADGAMHQTRERATRPTLLPGMQPVARNALVYASTTALFAIVSCGLVIFGTSRSLTSGRSPLWTAPWSLCGLPALAFFAGYFIVANFGRPRVDTGQPHNRSVRLGGLICFAGMWLIWLIGISVR